MKFAKKKDIAIVAIIAIIFVILYFILKPDDAATLAAVEYNGEQIMELRLEGDGQEVAMPHNENVVLAYGAGGIKFIASDCPDKVCIHSGLLSHSGEIAACLPNGTVVTVGGENTDIVVR